MISQANIQREEPEPTARLRFVVRNGQRILQQEMRVKKDPTEAGILLPWKLEWHDVKFVDAENITGMEHIAPATHAFNNWWRDQYRNGNMPPNVTEQTRHIALLAYIDGAAWATSD